MDVGVSSSTAWFDDDLGFRIASRPVHLLFVSLIALIPFALFGRLISERTDAVEKIEF